MNLRRYKNDEFAQVSLVRIRVMLTHTSIMLKMKITVPRILPRFPTTSEMFPLKLTRQWYDSMSRPCTNTFL